MTPSGDIKDNANWATMATLSEADRACEWRPIAWVLRNRVEASTYPSTYPEVILQPFQFSYFNRFLGGDLSRADIFDKCYARFSERADWFTAFDAVVSALNDPTWTSPVSSKTFNFWSPGAMQPKGSLPKWDFNHLRCYALPHIDPLRFVFAERVYIGHPEAGRPRQFDYSEHFGGAAVLEV